MTYELPEALRTPEGRRAALEDAKRRIEERKGQGGERRAGRADRGRSATVGHG